MATKKNSRQIGADFERRVRKDIESKGWFVCKWQNQVDLKNNCIVPAKPGYYKLAQTGWPDFLCYRQSSYSKRYHVLGVEVRVDGYITPDEKKKIQFYLTTGVFNKFFVASKLKVKNRVVIRYKEIKKEDSELNLSELEE